VAWRPLILKSTCIWLSPWMVRWLIQQKASWMPTPRTILGKTL